MTEDGSSMQCFIFRWGFTMLSYESYIQPGILSSWQVNSQYMSSVSPTGQYKYRTSPFFIFRWSLAMLFGGWTVLSVCQDDLSCKSDVKCLDDELSCKNMWPLIHTWSPSAHQKYMATNLLNMKGPILKIEEDEVPSVTCFPQAQLVYNWLITRVVRAYNNELHSTFHLLNWEDECSLE